MAKKAAPKEENIDPQIEKVASELREWAKSMPDRRPAASGINPKQRLLDFAERLENSSGAVVEDVYGYCQELINPHIKPDSQGMISITEESLIPSVAETMQYLIEFWLANRDKPGIDHRL